MKVIVLNRKDAHYDHRKVVEEKITPLVNELVEIFKREKIPFAVGFMISAEEEEYFYHRQTFAPGGKIVAPELSLAMSCLNRLVKLEDINPRSDNDVN